MTSKIQELLEELDTDDVGQKKYIMNQIFDLVLKQFYQEKDLEIPDIEERISRLNGLNGYLYKLSQDFLTTSSTLEKETKLKEMVEHLEE